MKKSSTLRLVLTAVTLALIAAAAQAGDGTVVRPAGNELIPDQYLVTFVPGADPAATAHEVAATHGGQVDQVFEHVRTALFKMNEGQAQGVSRNPNVERVEQDSLFTVDGAGNQPNPPSWGIDRVDQRNLPLDNNYSFCFMGTGVDLFVLDTGIRTTHVDFGGRAVWGIDCTGEGQNDGHGHGTHVSGTAGSATYGVAKDVNLIAVKVCNSFGSCPTSAITCGTNFVTQQKQASPATPMVANMSLGGGFSPTLNNAVASSVAAGIFYAVAAGNNSSDACNFSPASEPTAYTLGSSTITDARSSFSNFGTCVDIFAPGSAIVSTWNTSNTATATLNGTSMASPHAAGAGALVLEEHPTWTPAQVDAELDARGTAGVLSGVGAGSPNLLLFTKPGAQCPSPGGSFQTGLEPFDHVIRTVALTGFSDPVVVLGPPSFNGNHPSTTRVRNVTASSFQHNLQEWDYLDGTHGNTEDVGYLAVERSTASLGSLPAEAGTVTINQNWTSVAFTQSFSGAPVVITQVGTINGGQAVTTRVRNVSASGFEVRLQEEEANDGTHNPEVVHWIAVTPGSTTTGGRTVVVGTQGGVTDAFATIGFGQTLSNPVFIADMQTFAGNNPATLRYQNLSTTSVQVKVEEEQSLDAEVGHVAEVVGFIAISQ